MTEFTQDNQDTPRSLFHLVIGTLVFGSVWGFLEATLGGYMHLVLFPNKGGIMSGIGVALMAAALAIYRRPRILPFIGLVAASFKLLDVWLFSLPVTSIHIVNPAMAIVFEALAFGLLAAFLMKRVANKAFAGVAGGTLAGLLSAVIWACFAIYIMNAPAYNRVVFTVQGFIANQGVIQAVFCGVLAPLGYFVGDRLASRIYSPSLAGARYYAASAAVIVVCWVVSTVAVVARG